MTQTFYTEYSFTGEIKLEVKKLISANVKIYSKEQNGLKLQKCKCHKTLSWVITTIKITDFHKI